MKLLYNIVVGLYVLMIRGGFLFKHKKARLWINGRKNWKQNLQQKIIDGEKWIWFHCSSLGEFEDGRELIDKVKLESPSLKILLTFFSPSGYEIRKNYSHADCVMYLPADFPKNAKTFLDILKPKVIFFIHSEIWFNYISEIHKIKIPLYLASIAISSESKFLKWPGRLMYRKAFSYFDYIFCHDEKTKFFLSEHFNVTKISITGNMRFDRVFREAENEKHFPEIKNFSDNKFCIIAGSTLAKDEKIILESLGSLADLPFKLIMVPHDPDEEKLKKLQNENTEMIAYSNIAELKPSHKILWIDCVGILASLYRYADVAIIGGGFNSIGIHNILEPAVYGVPVAFGPNHRNYTEALEMLDIGYASIFMNTEDLTTWLRNAYQERENNHKNQKIKSYIEQNTGATEMILLEMRETLNKIIQ